MPSATATQLHNHLETEVLSRLQQRLTVLYASASKDLLLRPLGCSCCCAGLQAAKVSQNEDDENVMCEKGGCKMHPLCTRPSWRAWQSIPNSYVIFIVVTAARRAARCYQAERMPAGACRGRRRALPRPRRAAWWQRQTPQAPGDLTAWQTLPPPPRRLPAGQACPAPPAHVHSSRSLPTHRLRFNVSWM